MRIQNGEGDWGYGWMFQHAGNCYVVLPEHVAGELPIVTVATAAPVQSDQATVVKPFWQGLDLAIAVLDRGPLDERCISKLDELKPTNTSLNASSALVLRITPVGNEERLPIRVLDRGYLEFVGELVRDEDAVGQGTSGSFAFVDGRPIGMAVIQIGEQSAKFIRSEEIAMNVGRFLSEQGRAFATSTIKAETTSLKGLRLSDVRTNTPPILPQFSPENLLGDGLFVTMPNGPVEITFRIGTDDPVGINRFRMSTPSDTEHAVPKAVTLFLGYGESADRFRFWAQGEMHPDGIFDTGLLAEREARWIKVVIRSAWGEGTIAVDRIMAN